MVVSLEKGCNHSLLCNQEGAQRQTCERSSKWSRGQQAQAAAAAGNNSDTNVDHRSVVLVSATSVRCTRTALAEIVVHACVRSASNALSFNGKSLAAERWLSQLDRCSGLDPLTTKAHHPTPDSHCSNCSTSKILTIGAPSPSSGNKH